MAKQVLAKVISQMHLMLHPLMPHLTEELWHSVTGEPENTFLALQPWPVVDEAALNDDLEASFAELIGACLLYTSPSPRDVEESRMPSSA